MIKFLMAVYLLSSSAFAADNAVCEMRVPKGDKLAGESFHRVELKYGADHGQDLWTGEFESDMALIHVELARGEEASDSFWVTLKLFVKRKDVSPNAKVNGFDLTGTVGENAMRYLPKGLKLKEIQVHTGYVAFEDQLQRGIPYGIACAVPD